MKNCISVLFLLLCFASARSQSVLRGKVIDRQTRQPLEYAVVSAGEKSRKAITDQQGNFELKGVTSGDSLFISYVGYRRMIIGRRKQDRPLLVEMERGSVDLRTITILPFSNNASFCIISDIDRNLRPVNSAQDLMRLVPGLFLGQHQGGGIAEHIFFRGFDADHGTDVNVSVDGMPLNLVSHAHGQGFSDLHFLIPELVTGYEFGKGPYYADHGDFTTAGYVAFRTADMLDKSEVKIEGGQFHTGRVMAMADLLGAGARKKGESAYIAGEAAYTDGPFVYAQQFNRLNLFGKYNLALSLRNKMTLTLSSFSSGWRSSGEIPERAVSEGLTGRFGYIDSAQGGYTSRSNAILRLSSSLPNGMFMENQVYYSRYFFNLHYDETFFANDSINGDQLRQRESRDLFGYNGKISRHHWFGGDRDLISSFGIGAQLNKIYGSELSHTKDYDDVLNYIQHGDVNEMALNAYADKSYYDGKWVVDAGVRLDWLYFDYRDKLDPVQPARAKLIASPKFNISYDANEKVQVYLRTGKGFHSNDAKAVAANRGLDVLPAAYGADLGINWKPAPRLLVNAGVWALYLQQEFVYNGDDGTFSPGDKTKREGVDLSLRYQFLSWLYGHFDMNLARARDLGAQKGNDYLPLAVPLSGTGGLDVKLANGLSGGLSYRYMEKRPANADNSLVAQGYFVSDLTANYRKGKYEIGLEIQNLFNAQWREAQFEVVSRLKKETQPVVDISFAPGTPFFAKLKMAVFF